jgi:bacterioferritin (cytochrome b1)
MAEAQAAVNKIIGGQEGRKKMNDARKEATDAGKKGKELQEAVLASLDLSDEDAEAYKEADAAVKKLTAEVRAELAKTLSEDKLEKLGMKGRGEGKGKKKKNKDG